MNHLHKGNYTYILFAPLNKVKIDPGTRKDPSYGHSLTLFES